MKDKLVEKGILGERETGQKGRMTPLEIIMSQGGRAHKVGGMAGREADSMIAVYKDRFTYTFMMSKEVASIHFDKMRRNIYFSGHNIQNMKLTGEQREELYKIINVLESDDEGRELKSDYEATLGTLLADNK